MDYDIPEALEFFEREFGLSDKHDPDEGVFSYIKLFENEEQLIFSYSLCGNGLSEVRVQLIQGDLVVFNIYQELVSQICFQAWGNEKVIRVYSNDSRDFLIYFNPKPRLLYTELTDRAIDGFL